MQYLQGIARRLQADEVANWKRCAASYSDLDDEELTELAESLEPFDHKHNPVPDSFLECSECGEDAVIQIQEHQDIGVCTNLECRHVSKITECFVCSERVANGSMICGRCSEYIRTENYQRDKRAVNPSLN
jgi:hypothetical protein